MSTRTLTGTYSSGYAIVSSVTVLSITASGYVKGSGVSAAAGASPLIVNYGRVLGATDGIVLTGAGTIRNLGSISSSRTSGGEEGVYLRDGGEVINGASGRNVGYLLGYESAIDVAGKAGSVINYGTIASIASGSTTVILADGGSVVNAGEIEGASPGYVFGRGDAGVGGGGVLVLGGSLSNSGAIRGGAGGGDYYGGGSGGAGVALSGGSLSNGGSIAGGAGGDGYIYGPCFGGSGGAGVEVASASLTNNGVIVGGVGGAGGFGGFFGTGGYGGGGAGGIGLAAYDSSIANFGTIVGGRGGYCGAGYYDGGPGGAGGVGVSLTGESLTNGGVIVGGAGGAGGSGDADGGSGGSGTTGGDGGTGGSGVAVVGGSLANSGTIVGGAGGANGYDKYGSTEGGFGGAGVALAGGSVSNTGEIIGGVGGAYGHAGDGVDVSGADGVIVNGSAKEKTARIDGYLGVSSKDTDVTVVNFGTITGAVDGILSSDASVTNGSAKDTSARIAGALSALVASATVSVTNFGTMSGGSGAALSCLDGGSLTNGSANDKAALISGAAGIASYDGPETIKNFATISASGGYGAYLVGGGVLDNGSASDLTASITGNEGVRLGGGASGLNFGTINGTGGYGAVLGLGDNLTNGSASDSKALISGGVYVYGGDTVNNFGTIARGSGYAVEFQADYATLVVEAGSAFIGTVNGDGAAIDLASGVGKITGLFVGGDLTVSGSMAATTFSDFGTLEIGAGAQFTDETAVSIAAGQAVEVSGSLTLGGGVTNGGLIEAFTGGTMALLGAVTNTGTLETHGGTLSTTGAVSGAGVAVIAGGTLDMGAAFMENVTFSGGGGVLELARSRTYTGTVTGFSKTGTTSFDLLDVGFVSSTEATYSGTKTGGVLTVSDGTTTAHITLVGNYLSSTWVASSDGHGGVSVVDPPAQAPATHSTAAFASAMASMAPQRAGPLAGGERHAESLRPMLSAPRANLA